MEDEIKIEKLNRETKIVRFFTKNWMFPKLGNIFENSENVYDKLSQINKSLIFFIVDNFFKMSTSLIRSFM